MHHVLAGIFIGGGELATRGLICEIVPVLRELFRRDREPLFKCDPSSSGKGYAVRTPQTLSVAT